MKPFGLWLSLDEALACSYHDFNVRRMVCVTAFLMSVVGVLIGVGIATADHFTGAVWCIAVPISLAAYFMMNFIHFDEIEGQVLDRIHPILRDYRDYLVHAEIGSGSEVPPATLAALGASVIRRVGALQPLERDVYRYEVKELRDDLEKNGLVSYPKFLPTLRTVPEN